MFNIERERLVSAAEAARMLGVTPQTVARRVRAGELAPVVKGPGLRGAYLFDAEQIERAAAVKRSEAVAR